MDKIKLLTREGGFLMEAYIPHFQNRPEIVVSGGRIYRYRSFNEYVEALSYVIADGRETDPVRPLNPPGVR